MEAKTSVVAGPGARRIGFCAVMVFTLALDVHDLGEVNPGSSAWRG